MTQDLMYLAMTSVLTALLWLPYALGLAIHGGVSAASYRDPTLPQLPAWVQRCNRVHVNAVESFAPFAALVIVVHLAGVASETTAFWTMLYFWARLAHAIVFWAGIPYVRTLAFAAGLVSTLALFYEVLTATPVAG